MPALAKLYSISFLTFWIFAFVQVQIERVQWLLGGAEATLAANKGGGKTRMQTLAGVAGAAVQFITLAVFIVLRWVLSHRQRPRPLPDVTVW